MNTPISNPLITSPSQVLASRPTNTLGCIGLVLSMLGLLTFGLLSPLGLIFSLIGLFKAPRGEAIFGTILGLFGLFMFTNISLLATSLLVHH